MNNDNFIVVEYRDNFADNFTNYAYASILKKETGFNFCYENNPQKRKSFEDMMQNFNMDFSYISSTRVEKIAHRAFNLNKKYIKYKNIKKRPHANFLNLNRFRFDDIRYISNEIKSNLNFCKKEFIKSYDILEKITSYNSIGLYIDKFDIEHNLIDFDFILKAQKRINKYLKSPKLFIFAPRSIKNSITPFIDSEFIDFLDWREEFYFLMKCKNKIILNSQKSYSHGFWAAILNTQDLSINIYDKSQKTKFKSRNWIGV